MGRVRNQVPPPGARIFRSDASRGVHARALWCALLELEELVPAEPSAKRVALRDHRRALERAYPELKISATDVAQSVAEEDGEEIE